MAFYNTYSEHTQLPHFSSCRPVDMWHWSFYVDFNEHMFHKNEECRIYQWYRAAFFYISNSVHCPRNSALWSWNTQRDGSLAVSGRRDTEPNVQAGSGLHAFEPAVGDAPDFQWRRAKGSPFPYLPSGLWESRPLLPPPPDSLPAHIASNLALGGLYYG